MKTKQTIYTALLEAQKEIRDVVKDAKNPFFKSDYTTLDNVLKETKTVLNKHSLILLQPIESDENGVYVCTTVIHAPTGGEITSRHRISMPKNDPQAQGSAITYARRYSLKSLLALSDDDDDGEKAMKRDGNQSYQSEATEKQINLMNKLIRNGTIPEDKSKKICKAYIQGMSKQMASKIISKYMSDTLDR